MRGPFDPGSIRLFAECAGYRLKLGYGSMLGIGLGWTASGSRSIGESIFKLSTIVWSSYPVGRAYSSTSRSNPIDVILQLSIEILTRTYDSSVFEARSVRLRSSGSLIWDGV